MMNQASEVPGNRAFEFQNWTVYAKSVEFAKDSRAIASKLPNEGRRGLRDQLVRASESISLNIAEGSGRHTNKDKLSFFRVARGSVFECVAVLDLGLVSEFLEQETVSVLQSKLVTIGKMLSGFIKYLEKHPAPCRQ